jgi:selenocysteine lyase/cysteine desulfurase
MAVQTPDTNELIDLVRNAVIGERQSIPGPFGERPLVYADYTASGRALDFIERAISLMALPFYANTHTETSYSGLQTTRLREHAREAIRSAVGADDRHAVIFCGSGATSGVNKLVQALGLREPLEDNELPPIVFVGPYEHHSNDLPWRESNAEIVRIPLNDYGDICLVSLKRELQSHPDNPLKIGTFSAASNVTGVKTDMRALGKLLHAHGAWFFTDYAAGGPYLPIDMTESIPGANDHCDAIFVSPHKFIGGPGASGVLVADKRLFSNAIPSAPGGGTVSYVTASRHRYVANVERREEAGTPSILGDIRAGMVFRLKADIGAETIEALEHRAVAKAFETWKANPAIDILGPEKQNRLAIFSFNIKSGERHLHPNFVVALLNDLFGLQVRGGCSCAGPYGHELLGIAEATGLRYESLVSAGQSVFRPGWVRLSFNYFFDDETMDYILRAVDFVARRGTDFLPFYRLDPASGRWQHDGRTTEARIGFTDLCTWGNENSFLGTKRDVAPLSSYLDEAENIADGLACSSSHHPCPKLDESDRWFAIAEDFAA